MPVFRSDEQPKPLVELEPKIHELLINQPQLKNMNFYNMDISPELAVYPFCSYFLKKTGVKTEIGESKVWVCTVQFMIGAEYIPNDLNKTKDTNRINQLTQNLSDILLDNDVLDAYCERGEIIDIELGLPIPSENKTFRRHSLINMVYEIKY